jgi:hypothetical protein
LFLIGFSGNIGIDLNACEVIDIQNPEEGK